MEYILAYTHDIGFASMENPKTLKNTYIMQGKKRKNTGLSHEALENHI